MGDQVGVAAAREAEPGPRHLERGRQDRLVDDAHRGGGLGDAVQVDAGAADVAHPSPAAADGDALLEAQPLVLGDEAVQLLDPVLVLEDRLVLGEHLHVEEVALGAERDEEVHRGPGEARDRRQVDRLEGVADQVDGLPRRPGEPEDGPDRHVLLPLPDAEGSGEGPGQALPGEHPGSRRRGTRQEQRHEQEPEWLDHASTRPSPTAGPRPAAPGRRGHAWRRPAPRPPPGAAGSWPGPAPPPGPGYRP